MSISRHIAYEQSKDKILLESRTENTDKSTIDICKELIQAHRVHENTKSRKRLEIWATVVISIYIVLICFLFILNSLTIDGEKVLSCDSNLMIALLTTTTINILGLVVIVLKGYFPPKSNKDSEKE